MKVIDLLEHIKYSLIPLYLVSFLPTIGEVNTQLWMEKNINNVRSGQGICFFCFHGLGFKHTPIYRTYCSDLLHEQKKLLKSGNEF